MDIKPAPYSKGYDISEAMFGAFRTEGGMPFFWRLFGWGTLLLSVIGFLSIGYLLGAYADMIRASAMMETDPELVMESLRLVGEFFLAMLLFVIGYAAVMAVIRGAFFRGYFHGDFGGTMPLRLGADEVRIWLSYLGYMAVLIVAIMVLSIVMMVPMMLLATVMGSNSIVPVLIGVFLLYGALLVAYVFFGVRLATASALTSLMGKTHVLAARHVTKHRFWPLFGSILVAGLIGYVGSYVASSVSVLMAFPSLDMSDLITLMSGLDPEGSVDAVAGIEDTSRFALPSIIGVILVSAGYVFYMLMLAGPQAFFTRQWAEAGGIPAGSNVTS